MVLAGHGHQNSASAILLRWRLRQVRHLGARGCVSPAFFFFFNCISCWIQTHHNPNLNKRKIKEIVSVDYVLYICICNDQPALINHILSLVLQTAFYSIISLLLCIWILLSSFPDLGVQVKSLKRRESEERLEPEAVDLTLSSDTEDVIEMLDEQPEAHFSPPLCKGQPFDAVNSSWL